MLCLTVQVESLCTRKLNKRHHLQHYPMRRKVQQFGILLACLLGILLWVEFKLWEAPLSPWVDIPLLVALVLVSLSMIACIVLPEKLADRILDRLERFTERIRLF